jgi:hypothetical protein
MEDCENEIRDLPLRRQHGCVVITDAHDRCYERETDHRPGRSNCRQTAVLLKEPSVPKSDCASTGISTVLICCQEL